MLTQSSGGAAALPDTPSAPDLDLGHHGDVEAVPGLVDLAVNVRQASMPDWLADPITAALGDLARYPDSAAARAAVAARHGRCRPRCCSPPGRPKDSC